MTLIDAINWPHPLVKQAWDDDVYPSGVTEPWVQQAVAALLVASGQTSVLELGSYLGLTTAWLACALQRMGGGILTTVELEPERIHHTMTLLAEIEIDTPDVEVEVLCSDTILLLQRTGLRPGFAWVDDDHTPAHVDEELTLLRPLMKPGGLICMHDVHGPLGLDAVCERHGGYVLRFPVLGPAGGFGVIQL